MKLEELNKLCELSEAKLANRVSSAICKYNKDIFIMEPEDWINIFKQFNMQKVTIQKTRAELYKIYDYAKNNGIVMYNPFDSLELSVNNISSAINQNIYVSQETLNGWISKLDDDLISGCMTQLIYEGAKSYSDIFNLQLNDIDFENCIIRFDEYCVYASSKLMQYIKDYIKNDEYVTGHHSSKTGTRSYPVKRVREGGFVKIIMFDNNKSRDDYKTFTNSMSNILMRLGVTKAQLYNSGFLNFIYRKSDFSLTELGKLINTEYTKDSMKYAREKLNEYAEEYGFISETVNIRYLLKDYYNSFLYQLTPFM